MATTDRAPRTARGGGPLRGATQGLRQLGTGGLVSLAVVVLAGGAVVTRTGRTKPSMSQKV